MVRCGLLIYLWQNIIGFIESRPPIAVIMLFIATLSLSLFTLSHYVENKDIVDLEATKKYGEILDSLLDLSFCLTPTTKQLNHTDIKENMNSFGGADLINVSIPLVALLSIHKNFTMNADKNISQINGLIPYFYLLHDDDHHHSIPIQTSLQQAWQSKSCKPGSCDPIKVCVTLQIKKEVIPNHRSFEGCHGTISLVAQETISMHPLKSDRVNKRQSTCEQPGLQLNFKTTKHKYTPYIYLDMWTKSRINAHLHLASYIFFVILLSTLIYAMMKGRAASTSANKSALKVSES